MIWQTKPLTRILVNANVAPPPGHSKQDTAVPSISPLDITTKEPEQSLLLSWCHPIAGVLAVLLQLPGSLEDCVAGERTQHTTPF